MSDSARFAGKVAVVSGGSRGLGAAIVRALAGEGADVAFSYRKEAKAAREVVTSVEHLGRRALAVPSNTADAAETESFVQQARAKLGRIDIVVANAGISGPEGWEALTPDAWKSVLDTNLVGAYELFRAARPLLAHSEASVVFLASTGGMIAFPEYLPYSVSKAGVIAMTRSLALAMAPKVRVNAVAPGWIRTDMNAVEYASEPAREEIRQRIPRGRWGEPDDIAAAVVFLASDLARFVTGETLVVDGGGRHRWTAGSF
jgi:3-oxoacyl-[acyl-carrier protein] reductase